MTLQIPYVGPGADNSSSPFEDLIANLVAAPAGTPPTPSLPTLKPGSVMAMGANTGFASDGTSRLYSKFGVAGSLAIFDFTDPNCFPLASSATGVAQPADVSTVIVDLVHLNSGTPENGQTVGALFPFTADTSTAAPLSYMKSHDGKNVGILFSDSNAGAVAECINLNTQGLDALFAPFKVVFGPAPTSFVWAITIETPATLSVGDASLLTVGTTLDETLQVAFVVKDGSFGAYVNGTNYVSFNNPPSVSTKYLLMVHYEVDPNNPLNFLVTLSVGGNVSATKSIPFPVNETPWSVVQRPTDGLHSLAGGGSTPQIGFGPLPDFGGQWAFLALGYYAEDLSGQPLRSADVVRSVLQSNFQVTTAF